MSLEPQARGASPAGQGAAAISYMTADPTTGQPSGSGVHPCQPRVHATHSSC
jgi:hypothetical protein